MNRQRALSITRFTKKYLKDDKFVKKKRIETWQDYALRLENEIFGLGYAKTRFAIELLYPLVAKVVCTDTHILQWAKQKNGAPKGIHKKVEQGFINHSRNIGIPPVEARWRMWDKIQGYNNPRYWSWVLE
jgi:hypothetical protein